MPSYTTTLLHDGRSHLSGSWRTLTHMPVARPSGAPGQPETGGRRATGSSSPYGIARGHPCCLKPFGDGGRIEAQQVPPLHVRDSPLVDQPADVADTHPQVLGD